MSLKEEKLSTFPPFVSKKFYLLAFAVIIAVGFSVYSNILNAPFVYDDVVFRDNPITHITRLSQLFDILLDQKGWRRVGFLTFACNFYLGGLNPFGYHLVNIIIHLLNSMVLFVVVFKTLTIHAMSDRLKSHAPKIALLGSLIWLVHPIQIMAVSYTAQRFASLAALFFLLCLLCYILGRTRTSQSRTLLLGLSFLSGLLAFGSKENAFMLPFVIFMYELFFFRNLSYKINKKSLLWGSVLVFIISLVLIIIYVGPDFLNKINRDFMQRGLTAHERLITEFRVVVLYLTLLVYPYPSRLNVDYDFPVSHGLFSPPSTFLSFILLASLLAFSIYRARRHRLFSFAVLWFFVNLVVESTIYPLDLVYEHRLYLPSMGPIALFAGIIYFFEPFQFKKLGIAVGILIIVLFSYWTYERNLVWKNPVALWEDNVKKSPNKARVHGNLGKAYLDSGEYEKARIEFEKVIELDPTLLGAYDNLAIIYIEHFRQYEKARKYLYEAIRQKDDYPSPYLNLGVINLHLKQLPEAISNFEKVLELDPNNLLGHYNLAASYFNLEDYQKAISILEKGISVWPKSSKLYGLLGVSHYYYGNREKADTTLRQALDLDPNNGMAATYLKKIFVSKGTESP
jgi:tetratricopeptide (TPR) repeat protein